MATVKFDRIAIAFMAKAKDTFVTSFTAGGGALPLGHVLINDGQIESYINRALSKLFSDVWAEGKVKGIVDTFPELLETRDITFNGSGRYTLVTPNLDMFYLVGGTADLKNAQITDRTLYPVIKSGNNFHLSGDSDNPIMIYMDSIVHVFPDADFGTKDGALLIIKKPVDPTTGGLLSQNGSYDSPFDSHWDDKLSELAYQFYLTDSTKE